MSSDVGFLSLATVYLNYVKIWNCIHDSTMVQ